MSAVITACPACGAKNRVPASASGTPRCGTCKASLPWLVEASGSNFDDVVSGAGHLPVLVDLWAPWCGPCRLVEPGVERAAQELAGNLKVVKVNVDEAPEVSTKFGVQGIPTLLVLCDGRPVAEQVGALPADQLLQWVRGAAAV
jgi:thioredoxin 2